MRRILNIGDSAYQTQAIFLDNGESVNLTISFKPQQLGWFIESLTYLDFELKGVRICTGPDILYQFKNILPFGIACFCVDAREPYLQTDFKDGSAQLYVLTAAEVLQLQAELQGG